MVLLEDVMAMADCQVVHKGDPVRDAVDCLLRICYGYDSKSAGGFLLLHTFELYSRFVLAGCYPFVTSFIPDVTYHPLPLICSPFVVEVRRTSLSRILGHSIPHVQSLV